MIPLRRPMKKKREPRAGNWEIYHQATKEACPQWIRVSWASRSAALLGAKRCDDRTEPRHCPTDLHKVRSLPLTKTVERMSTYPKSDLEQIKAYAADVTMEDEVKAIVAVAFRNGPLEDIHAGKDCPTCHRGRGYSRITQEEMKELMKYAVDRLYAIFRLKKRSEMLYKAFLKLQGEYYTKEWDPPSPVNLV